VFIRGHINHIFSTDIDSRRGPVTLTSVWIVDRHDYVTPTKQSPTLYEVQYLDDKTHSWEDALDAFADGDRVLAVIRDDIEVCTSTNEDGSPRTWIKARGLDLASSSLDRARR